MVNFQHKPVAFEHLLFGVTFGKLAFWKLTISPTNITAQDIRVVPQR
jgi:hypothetical protein